MRGCASNRANIVIISYIIVLMNSDEVYCEAEKTAYKAITAFQRLPMLSSYRLYRNINSYTLYAV